MVLVDTSVWLRALAGRQPFARALDALLDGEEVLGHEMVYGELLVGDRGARAALLADYELITHAPTVPDGEFVAFVCARPGRVARGVVGGAEREAATRDEARHAAGDRRDEPRDLALQGSAWPWRSHVLGRGRFARGSHVCRIRLNQIPWRR